MSGFVFPSLNLSDWLPTRDTIHSYAKVIGEMRRVLSVRQKHWGNLSLRLTATGLTTRPLAAGIRSIELVLDLVTHRLIVSSSAGDQWMLPLSGQSSMSLCEQTLATLQALDVHLEVDRGLFNEQPGEYDVMAVRRFWSVLSQLDMIFKRFKASLRNETSPVEIWPHNFDLAMLWFSGRLVPGQDPSNAEYADEQMNFGFVTGDRSIPEPYFYATAYPLPPALSTTMWPEYVTWHSVGWNGAVMLYKSLIESSSPEALLMNFLQTTQQTGARLMK